MFHVEQNAIQKDRVPEFVISPLKRKELSPRGRKLQVRLREGGARGQENLETWIQFTVGCPPVVFFEPALPPFGSSSTLFPPDLWSGCSRLAVFTSTTNSARSPSA